VADEEVAVLGLSTGVEDDALLVQRVIVRVGESGVRLVPLDAWGATPRDEARSLADFLEALTNTLDPKRAGGPRAVAIKRVESPSFGRPSASYDQRTRAEGAAMIAAANQGARYFGFRTGEIRPRGTAIRDAAAELPEYEDEERRDAIDAACAALGDLGVSLN
jgi:hypothetical protein